MKRASARVASSAILSTTTKLPASTTLGRQLVSSVRLCSATSTSVCFSRGMSFSLPSKNDDDDKHQPIRVIPGCKAIPTRTIITEAHQGIQLSVRSVHSSEASKQDYLLPHPIWKGEYVDAVKVTHREPVTLLDKAAYYSVKLMRFNFDWMSGFTFGRSESKWLSRMMYLETVAGVPGSLAAMIRHLNSLRRVERDHGWIHTLLEEAENERMHLLVALQLKKPTLAFRAAIWVTQGIFANFWFLSYILSPTFCHRFVGYLEEEAVKTYTKMLEDIDHGCLKHWATTPAPEIAKHYWKLPENSTMREVIAIVRADEAHHRQVNHEFSSLKKDQDNPFAPGY